MNAVNTLLRERAETLAETAAASANRWFEQARPIIQACLDLDEMEGNVRFLGDLPGADSEGQEAASHVNGARESLFSMLDGIRDRFICDMMPPHPTSGSAEHEWDAYDELREYVESEVISVKLAFAKVARS
jgi:hypothetical protein